jgi:hypothetical protein
MLDSICPVGRPVVMRTYPSHEIIDLADYIFSNPNVLDLKVQGIWLGSRMYG